MAIRIQWDQEETAILLDAFLQADEGSLSRKEAIQMASVELRDRAKKSGIDVDDKFRNINGITLQMSVLEYIYTNGNRGLKKPVIPKLFRDVVELYRSDKPAYLKLLQGAKQMGSESASVQKQFFTWLSAKVSPAQLSELYPVFADVESFCLSRHILKNPLFETTDLITLNAVKNFVETNKVFRFNFKRQLSKISSGIRFYITYTKENCIDKPAPQNSSISEATEAAPSINVVTYGASCTSSCYSTIKREPAVETMNVEPANEDEKVHVKRRQFIDWMMKSGVSTATVFSYLSATGQCSKSAKEYNIIDKDLTLISDLSELTLIKTKLFAQPYFKELNAKQHNRFHAAFEKYISFQVDVSSGAVTPTAKPTLMIKSTDTLEHNVPEISDKTRSRYSTILAEDFENGFRPDKAIDNGRFKKFYTERFGETPSESDKCIVGILTHIGTLRDDRIFPKQDE
jgi:hypothetical protein